MRIQRAGQPQQPGAEREGLHLEGQHPLAGDRRDHVILADRAQHAAERGGGQPGERPGGQADHGPDDDDELQVEQQRAEHAAPRGGDGGNAVGAVGQPDFVGGGKAYHLGKAEGDDGEIVAAQPGGDQRHGGT